MIRKKTDEISLRESLSGLTYPSTKNWDFFVWMNDQIYMRMCDSYQYSDMSKRVENG